MSTLKLIVLDALAVWQPEESTSIPVPGGGLNWLALEPPSTAVSVEERPE